MKTLIIVEPDFLKLHIGVLRVIMYYYHCLKKLNHSVDFATPRLGKLYVGSINISLPQIDKKPFEETAFWTSESITNEMENETENEKETINIVWTDQTVNPFDYDINLISNPWVCALGLPILPNAIGIIYDMVPTLIACGILKLPVPIDIYNFAKEHDAGYCYYLANAKKITCISNSTKSDFCRLYKTSNYHDSIVTDIPFNDTNIKLSFRNPEPKNLILVNILDWRKNLLNTEKVLISAASTCLLNVCIIGKERIPMKEAIEFMKRLTKVGIKVEWYRNAGHDLLTSKYLDSSVLLFPSLYEGLGLPVLEAQSFGLPAITSNNSSIIEINMNKNLCFDTDDIGGMAKSIVEILENPSQFKSGQELKNIFKSFLNENQNPKKLFQL
jgi:glycosyltransferase involved in cell wall biosynthesis